MQTKLPYSYFLDEVRDGFFVPGMMKRVWAVCQENYAIFADVMKNIGGVCYGGYWGTMLGAIRCSGFVPWDDDLDLFVFHSEYEQIKEYSDNGGFPDDYHIRDYVMDKTDNEARKFHDSKTTIIDQSRWPDHFGYPYDNNIDLFILDYAPKGDDEKKKYKELLKSFGYLKTMAQKKENNSYKNTDEKTISERKKLVITQTGIDAERFSDKPEYMRWMMACDEYCASVKKEDGDEVVCVPYFTNYDYQRFPSFYFDTFVDMPFEGSNMKIPAGYDGMLRQNWGVYMRPVNNANGHDYPCFEGYEEDLKELFGAELYKYHIDMERLVGDLKERPHKKAGKKWRIAFLPYMASHWDSLHGLWKEMNDRDDVDVSVIPIPYFYRGFDGNIISDEMNLEIDGFPEEVKALRFDELDISDWHPDVIVFQFPYDEYCDSMDVLPFFHSSNLVKYTDNLVFIPPFVPREVSPEDEKAKKMLRRYLNTPGMIYADRVFVQSERMKEVYCELIGEFIENEINQYKKDEIPEMVAEKIDISKKIYGLGAPIYDMVTADPGNKSGEKTMLLHLSGSRLYCAGDQAGDRFREVVSALFERRDDIMFGILKDRYAEEILKEKKPELLGCYDEIIALAKDKGGKVFEPDEEDEAVEFADGFYGDGCVAMNKCRMAGKPVMMENFESVIDQDGSYETKSWTSELTVVGEGEWSFENFLNEVLIYKPDNQEKKGSSKRIMEAIEGGLDRSMRVTEKIDSYSIPGTDGSPRILFYEWKSYMRHDTKETLDRMRIQYDTYFYEDYQSLDKENLEFEKDFTAKLRSGGYDAVFSINYRTVIARCANEADVIYISWVYDCPFGIGEDEDILRLPTNRIFTFDRRTKEQLNARGIMNVFHQPLAVNIGRVDEIGISPEDRESYGADVSFVGKLYPSTFAGFYGKLSEYEAGMVDCALEAQSKMYGGYLLDVMTEGLMSQKIHQVLEGGEEYDFLFHESLQSIISKEITRRERLSILYMLSQEYNVALYTDQSESMLDKVSVRGIIDGYEEIFRVYKTAKINLNISFKRITEGIPLRALEILGAGGFLLSNYQPELVEYFEPGVDCVVYDSLEDAYAKAKYYLEHEDERETIAKNGREKAKRFSYENCIRTILNTSFSTGGDQ